MASFKICVILAVVASMVNCQTNTESKGQEMKQEFQPTTVQTPVFRQSKQGGDYQNQQGVFSTVPSFQNQQDNTVKQREGGFPSIPSFPGFGQGSQGGFQLPSGFPQIPSFGQGQDFNIFNQFQNPFGEGFNFGDTFQNLPFFGQQEIPAAQNDYIFGQYQ